MQSHLLFDYSIPAYGRQTKVAWARNPSRGALVFVHGFNGAAIRTWADFPMLVRENAEFASWDAIFFGYDGLHSEVASSSADLRALLDAMEHPSTLYGSSDASPNASRRHPPSYERIVLIAHSLGAIVGRRAMLDGHNQSNPAGWAAKVELFNFAPAHGGAKLMAILIEAFGLLAPIVPILQLVPRFIVLRDLKVGGPTVTRLEAETHSAVLAGKKNLRALDAVWARDDNIVTNGPFADDPAPAPGHVVRGKSHSSVCKPSDGYHLPLNSLKRHL